MIKKRTKRTIQNLCLLIFVILFMTLIFELTLRLFFPQQILKHSLIEASPSMYNDSDYLPRQLKPSTSTRHINILDEWNVSVNINSLGFRDDEFPPDKPQDLYRILVVGDSFTFGYGVENDESYSKRLQDLLNKNASGKFQTINAGFASGNSPQTEYLFIKNEGLQLKPDLVIMGLFVGNDFSDFKDEIQIINDKGEVSKIVSKSHYIDSRNRLRNKDSFYENSSFLDDSLFKRRLYDIKVFFSFHSHFYILLKDKLRPCLNNLLNSKQEPSIYSEEYTLEIQNDVDKVLQDIANVNLLLKKEGIKFILVIIPRRMQVINTKIKDSQGNFLDLEKPNLVIKDFADSQEIEVIDFLYDFREFYKKNNKPLYFQFDGHWNKEGHDLAANIIFNKIHNNSF